MQKKIKQKKYRSPAKGGLLVSLPKLEQRLSNIGNRSPFMGKILSFFFLPIFYKFGLKVNSCKDNFYAEVPHKRFNRNAYGTFAGAAVLANLELAAGAFLLNICDSKYRLVCKNVNYSFKLPSNKGLHFTFESEDKNLDELFEANKPFNTTVRATVHTLGEKVGVPGRKIGRGTISFHLWPIPGLVS